MSLHLAFHNVYRVRATSVTHHEPDHMSDRDLTTVTLEVEDMQGKTDTLQLYLDGRRAIREGDELFSLAPQLNVKG